MISCYKLSLIISEFIDGELSTDVCYDIREHITYCPDCRREHEQFVKLLTFFHCHCTLRVPAEVHTELMELIQEEFNKPSEKLDKPRKSTKIRKKI